MGFKRVLGFFLFTGFLFTLAGQDLPVTAEEDTVNTELYALGDQTFAINAGVLFPLFFKTISSGETAPNTNLSIGLGGSLEWNAFLANNFSLGIEMGALFSFSPNSRTLIMVPITVKPSYWLHYYPLSIALSLSPGLNLCKLEDDYYIGPMVAPSVSGFWNYTSEWSFGADLKYLFIPQIYLENGSITDQSMFGNFLSLTLTAQYHF